ncbi:MAG: hypothetical protein EBY23_04905 [Actinobacteria bacterium]|nr:hypothetical protein [Actinomycetota bacterium]
MKIDLSYLPEEDRLCLSLQGQGGWLITRSLLIKLVNAWIDKLQKVDLPDVGFSLGNRDIGQEHALSLEFDGPTTTQKKPDIQVTSRLLQEVTLTVDSVGAKLVLKGDSIETNLTLTRKESHLVLEMLANKARAVAWLNEVVWPNWLGSEDNN